MRNPFYFAVCAAMIWLIGGCAYKVPVPDIRQQDIQRLSSKYQKIPAAIGISIRPDIEKYIYHNDKLGMQFFLTPGEYIKPLSYQIVKGMFDDAAYVGSLPPYKDLDSRIRLDGIVEPEILYAYGYAPGLVTGNIVAEFKVRLKGYDLRGNLMWQGDAMGVADSGKINLVNAFTNDLSIAGKTGYDAAFRAAEQVIGNFHQNMPGQAFALIRLKGGDSKQRNTGGQTSTSYQLGYELFSKRYYEQALYYFSQLEKAGVADAKLLFFIGVSHAYLGEKEMAIKYFKSCVEKDTKSKAADDSRQWLSLLGKKLPIKVLIVPNQFARSIYSQEEMINSISTMLNGDFYDIRSVSVAKSIDSAPYRNIENVVFIEVNAEPPTKHLDSRLNPDGAIAKTMEASMTTSVYFRDGRSIRFDVGDNLSTLIEEPSILRMMQTLLLRRLYSRISYALLENNVL